MREGPAHLGHSLHQRTIDDLERALALDRKLQIRSEALPGTFDDVSRQTLVQRQVDDRLLNRLPLPKMRGKRRDRFRTAVVEQVFAQLALLRRQRAIALQLLRSHPPHADSGLAA